jgi:CBS domain-containing protein
MLLHPKVADPATTIAAARALFADDHVHALLVVERGVLLAVVERADLPAAGDREPAAGVGRLAGRVVPPGADLDRVRADMAAAHTRRLAVVDADGRLLGLLCRKRSGQGFCSDVDARARALDTASGEGRGGRADRVSTR